jgi:hypothetical protein
MDFALDKKKIKQNPPVPKGTFGQAKRLRYVLGEK